jgi:hypothetical protein
MASHSTPSCCSSPTGVGLPVVEVPVRAEERDGSKVQLTVDALRMLRDVLIVRRGAAKGVYELARPEQQEKLDRLIMANPE